MKNKIFTGLMAVLMAASMPITAFAADSQSFTTDGSASIPVSCQLKSEYTVSLPAAFTLSDADGDGTFVAEGKVSVKGNFAADKKLLVVPTGGLLTENGTLTSSSTEKASEIVNSIDKLGYLDTLQDDIYKTDITLVNKQKASKSVTGSLTQDAVSFRSAYAEGSRSNAERFMIDKDTTLVEDVVLSVQIDEPAQYDGAVVYTFKLADDNR